MVALPPPVWELSVVTYQVPQARVEGADPPEVVNHVGVGDTAPAGTASVIPLTADTASTPPPRAKAITTVLSDLSPRVLFRRPFIAPLSSVSSSRQ